MLLTVYGSNKIKKATLSPNDSSTQVKALQADNVLTLSFTLYEYVALEVNDYVDYMGERYWLTKRYLPNEKNTQEWVYDVKFYGIESLIKRFLVLNTVDGDPEPVFTLTAPPREQVALVVASINAGMGTTDWKVGTVEGTENIVIDYEGKYCDDALREIAGKVPGTEWWLEGQTVNICRCEHGEEITLAYDRGITGIERDTADNVKFYTRLFPIGSSRNIDREKYGHSRLQLPGGAKYVDINTDKYGIYHHYEQAAFAGIYPRRTGTVSSVRSEEKTGEDGNPFTIYYFKDDAMNFNPNDYEISGLVKRVSFQEGSELAGLGADNEHYFEVNFDSNTREFEIVTIWPYDDGEQLPGGHLIPKEGDRYILWNLRMPDEYYPLAETEFQEAVKKYNTEHGIDISVYKCPTDHVYIEDNHIDLFVGRRVRLESKEYFPKTGYRSSRITKITRKVNLPSEMDLEISDALSTGVMEKIEDGISDIRNYTKAAAGALPDMIRSWESTLPTDNNLFSARRTIKEFISRLKDDVVSGTITFLRNIIVKGITRLQNTYFGDFLKGSSGAGIYKDESGNWHVEGDYFDIRKKLTAEEVEIQHSVHIGGKQINTSASMKCSSVEEFDDYYRCYFIATDSDGRAIHNQFAPDDQAYTETFNLEKQADGNTGNHFFWRLVVATGDNYIDLSKADCAKGSDAPAAGDDIIQLGNRTNVTRQGAIIDASAGSGAPYRRIYSGINSYTLPEPKIDLNTTRSTIRAQFISEVTGEDLETKIDGLGTDLDAVKEQNDKMFTIWFDAHVPTLENEPASEWTTDELLAEHNQDIFYNTSATIGSGGRAYRFEQDSDGLYSWTEITDADTIAAIEQAVQAENLAKGKRRNFVGQPTDEEEYDIGDTWSNASYKNDDGSYLYENDNLVCTIKKRAGDAFSINHWKPSSSVTTSYIRNLGNQIVAAVKNSNNNTEKISELNLTVGELSATVKKIQFDPDGKIGNISINGLVANTEFAALISELVDADNNVVKRAEIKTFITTDEAGELISNATIQADQINFIGKTIINGNFVVDEKGDLTVKNMTVTDGSRIAGLKVSGNSLTNEGFNNDAYIILRNDNTKCFAGIGGNTLPASSGIRATARFENEDNRYFASTNIALVLSAKNGLDNRAIQMNGGNIHGFAVATEVVSSNKTMNRGVVAYVTLNAGGTTIYLTFPTAEVCDDGLVIKIKRVGDGQVYLRAGKSKHRTLSGSSYTDEIHDSYICYDGNYYQTAATPHQLRVNEVVEYVYIRDLTYTRDGITYRGCWMQFQRTTY